MARRKNADGLPSTADYRHDEKRKNIPPAKIAGEGEIPKRAKVKYAYSPHLDPVLRFDPTGRADKVRAIVEKACRGERLDSADQEILRAVGANWEQPWLEWAGKQEEHVRGYLEVDPVALHIHERISAQAIVRNAMREDAQRSLFADPEQSYAEAIQFYKHDVDWANRLILGDSLQVMSSLAHRENLAGKVQMIYLDPPYGIKFASNFQPEVGRREVKEGKDDDLTREPEMVRAYRDTWHLGTSSYLSYLRDRIRAARTLLADSGSLFVQINAENLDVVRRVVAEVFDASCILSTIAFRKTSPLGSDGLATVHDYVVWACRSKSAVKYHQLYESKPKGEDTTYTLIELPSGERRRMTREERDDATRLPPSAKVLCYDNPRSSGYTASCFYPVHVAGRDYPAQKYSWKTNATGMSRLIAANRMVASPTLPYYVRFFSDFEVRELTSAWDDTRGEMDMIYVVQTATRVIERCMLMTTDPGDLVVDPTCGSGTTAYVAEQWGRRWITIDTSRVAVSLARARLMAANFNHYRTRRGPAEAGRAAENPGSGFVLRTVPHITLGAIAQNTNLDPILAKHTPILRSKIEAANAALARVDPLVREKLRRKLDQKIRTSGKKSVSDADRRLWLLPPDNRDPKDDLAVAADFKGWYDWEVPFDIDPDWPQALQDAVAAYRKAWRAKMDDVDRCIAENAEQEELVDQPEVVSGVVRVSGPFTVEGVIPEELSIAEDGVRDLTPNDFDGDACSTTDNAHAYLKGMLDAIRKDGVLFPGNRKRGFGRVEALYGEGGFEGLHAEAAWEGEEDLSVAVAFGPECGPVTARQVENLIRASRRYQHLVVAGFSFAPEASLLIEESKHPKLQIHMAHIRPDMNPAMKGLLKGTPNSQLFTVFGLPQVTVSKSKGGELTVTLDGVDIYDPVENSIRSTGASKVAAWFLDSDFDGRCFCVCQAFFPDRDAWDKIAKALGDAADPDAFDAFKGTSSLPFKPGKYRQIAVKVIDPRGNEVMTIRKLDA